MTNAFTQPLQLVLQALAESPSLHRKDSFSYRVLDSLLRKETAAVYGPLGPQIADLGLLSEVALPYCSMEAIADTGFVKVDVEKHKAYFLDSVPISQWSEWTQWSKSDAMGVSIRFFRAVTIRPLRCITKTGLRASPYPISCRKVLVTEVFYQFERSHAVEYLNASLCQDSASLIRADNSHTRQ